MHFWVGRRCGTILDPLGRWNIVCEESPERIQEGADAQVLRAGALCLAPFGLCFLPVAFRVF